jgi:hypothetical protein
MIITKRGGIHDERVVAKEKVSHREKAAISHKRTTHIFMLEE